MTILPPKGKRRTYYYDFQQDGLRYTKGGFRRWREAKAAESEKQKELKQRPPALTPTATDFRTLAYEYLDDSRQRHVDKTWKGKAYIYKRFLIHAGNLPVNEITVRMVESYLNTLPCETNYNRHRKFLGALFNWAFKRELLDKNPCLFVAARPARRRRKLIYSKEQFFQLLLTAGEWRPFFLTLFALAGRRDEISHLRWEDVDLARRQVSLWTRKGTGQWRRQLKPMNEELAQELRRLDLVAQASPPANPYVFPNPDTGLPYRNRRRQLAQACEAAALPNYGWHAIRHLALSLLAAGGIDLATIQQYAGHRSVHTTAQYIQAVTQDSRAAAELLSSESHANNPRESNKEEVNHNG